jgi:hypothetical protein
MKLTKLQRNVLGKLNTGWMLVPNYAYLSFYLVLGLRAEKVSTRTANILINRGLVARPETKHADKSKDPYTLSNKGFEVINGLPS